MSSPGTTIEVSVSVRAAQWRSLVRAPEALARRAVEGTLAAAPSKSMPDRAVSEVSVVLADDSFICELNATHRGNPAPTNVLSFPLMAEPPADGAHMLLGDVVLACETVASEAVAQGKPVAEHASHLIVHGTLHLLGYDHESDRDAEQMEALEVSVLAGMGIADPYRAQQDSTQAPAAGSRPDP